MLALGLMSVVALSTADPPTELRARVAASTGSSAAASLARAPLSFVPNRGQTATRVRFEAAGPGIHVYLTKRKVVLAFDRGAAGHALELRFRGANPNPSIEAVAPRHGRMSYLEGSRAHTSLPTYGGVVYRDLWPGIDLMLRGEPGKLKYEFLVSPGADPSQIRLAYAGAEGVSLSRGGALLVGTSLGAVRDARPRSWQTVGGRRQMVASRYVLGNGGAYGFAVGGHHANRPLVIDPGIVYSTLIGGSRAERGTSVAVDGHGSAYATGYTRPPDFPTTPGAYRTGGGDQDGFVAKLTPDGSQLAYAATFGGSSYDSGFAIAVDGAGAAYVTGYTDSPNFPTTAGALDRTYGGGYDAFAMKLSPDGSGLIYSTYLGGSSYDLGLAVAVDTSGNAIVSGGAGPGLATTAGAYQPASAGADDAFVTKLNATASAAVYSTYLGGARSERATGVAVDSSGSAYVTGPTTGLFPTTPGAYDALLAGSDDSFVAKLDSAGSALVYATLLGGSQTDHTGGVAVDELGSAYVAGATESSDFPTTAGAYDSSFEGASDSFVTKFDPTGSQLQYSTFLGDAASDSATAIALDAGRYAYVTGGTNVSSSQSDAYIKKLDPTGSTLAYSNTLVVPDTWEFGSDVAVDSTEHAYVVGDTGSPEFPVTAGAAGTHQQGTDAFVTKFGTASARDGDGDGVADASDNCAGVANPGQGNLDGDLLGDACDPDRDSDRIRNADDNCPDAANPSQRDADGDGTGDACDPDFGGGSSCAAIGLGQGGIAAVSLHRSAAKAATQVSQASLPLSFVPNHGQVNASVSYQAAGGGFDAYLTRSKAVLAFARGHTGHALELRFKRANPSPAIEPMEPRGGTVSYFTGKHGKAGLPNYGAIAYRDLWPGVDLVFRGADGSLKYEFHLRPGADPRAIGLELAGARGVSRAGNGALHVSTSLGSVRDSAPRSYQRTRVGHRAVQSHYVVDRARRSVGFSVGRYDPSKPLVIDPEIVYSTFVGARSTDDGNAVAVDQQGNAYITGMTASSDFPTTPGSFDPTQGSSVSRDVFITKLDPSGSHLVYSTFLGGAGEDVGRGIAVDPAGAAYVTGTTRSQDFPVTGGAADTTYNGGGDGFAARLDPSGSALSYSTFLGGTDEDDAQGIATDGTGAAYVAGETNSVGFPSTPGSFDPTYTSQGSETPFPQPGDAFVTKLAPTGSLVYSTFLGGGVRDGANGIAVDRGNAYVTGITRSGSEFDRAFGTTPFPTTPGAWDRTLGFGSSAFVTKLSADGSSLVYSTFLDDRHDLNGGGTTYGTAIAVGANGTAYVTGLTNFAEVFPTTLGAYDTRLSGVRVQAFVTEFDPAGSNLVYSTFLGGDQTDAGASIAIDRAGTAWVAGTTNSSGFPTTPDAFDRQLDGVVDGFVTRLNESGSDLLYSTFVGGAGIDDVRGIALDGRGNAYATGHTESDDFPVTPGAYDTTLTPAGEDEMGDAFVMKIGRADCDGDGVSDVSDNCAETPNPSQQDTDGDGIGDVCDPDPGSTPGCQIFGRGFVQTDPRARFDIDVTTDGSVGGKLTYRQDRSHLNFRSLEITSVLVDGTHAVIRGRGKSGPNRLTFRVDVDDLNPPRRDMFHIDLSNGYGAGGSVQSGRIDVVC